MGSNEFALACIRNSPQRKTHNNHLHTLVYCQWNDGYRPNNLQIKLQLVFLILLIPFSLAACSDGKVDINSASLSSLDKLTGIGPTYAQRIIDARPFSSLDDLLNVNGFCPATLE